MAAVGGWVYRMTAGAPGLEEAHSSAALHMTADLPGVLGSSGRAVLRTEVGLGLDLTGRKAYAGAVPERVMSRTGYQMIGTRASTCCSARRMGCRWSVATGRVDTGPMSVVGM